MSSLFYFQYDGNKRTEIKHFNDYLTNTTYDKIIEPFCGSCAISLHNYIKNNKKHIKYYLNDIETNLINFLNDVKNGKINEYFNFVNSLENRNTDAYNEIKQKYKNDENNVLYWFYHRSLHNFHVGVNPFNHKSRKAKGYLKNKYESTTDFFMSSNVILSNCDFVEIMERYKNDEMAMLFLDPPYFDSCNMSYNTYCSSNKSDEDGTKCDGSYMYVYLLNFMKTCKCKVIFIHRTVSIIEYIFKEFKTIDYLKQYGATILTKNGYKKNNTHHSIFVCNF